MIQINYRFCLDMHNSQAITRPLEETRMHRRSRPSTTRLDTHILIGHQCLQFHSRLLHPRVAGDVNDEDDAVHRRRVLPPDATD